MPDARPLTGLFGKVPAHGDFVRRGLPSSFVAPWDAWLQAGVAAAREQLGAHWAGAWDSAPAWRFALPAGACGPDAVAGVMLPSQDQVGRRFPITLAVLLPPGAPRPEADWFDAVEAAALAGLAGRADADALSAALPVPGEPLSDAVFVLPPVALALAPIDDAAGPWLGGERDPGLARDIDPAEDVLALLGGGPAAKLPAASGEDDALALLMGGGSAPNAVGALALETDTTPAERIGAATQAPPAYDPPFARSMGPDWPGSAPIEAAEGTLAHLIGAGAGAAPEGGSLPATDALPIEGDGVLAGLIGTAAPDSLLPADAQAEDPAPLPAPASGAADPVLAEGMDLLPETVPMNWPDLVEPAEVVAVEPTLAAPPAPDGGGWWTRGGANVPPMVWPLPGLPAPADFAYLLESAA